MRISKEEQIKQLAPLLKSTGFKKKSGTWRRASADGVHVVNIQGSQWGDEYYLNLGFYIRALGNEEAPTDYRCHVRERVDEPDREASVLTQEIERWFVLNGSVDELLKRHKAGALPLMTGVLAKEYLVQHDNSLPADRP